MSALKNLFDSSVIRYGIVGVANTLFGLTAIYCFKLTGLGDVMSNLFGYCCGLFLSFNLNYKWTFRYHGRLLSAFYIFCAVIIVSYLCNLAIVMLAIHTFTINSYLAQFMGIIPYTTISYLGCRFFVFPQKPRVECINH